jgi:uncharacterized protein (DUF2062 family)
MAKRKRNKLVRFLEYKILHIEDTPHKISLGVALGLFIAWSPLLGVHFLMIIVLSILLRANKFAAFASTLVSNVFTYGIIYYPSYLLGRIICDFFPNYIALGDQQVSSLFNKLFAPSNMLTGFYTKEYWSQFWTLLKQIGPELWIGCTLLGGAIAVASYIVCYYLIKSHRAQNPHRRYRNY